MASVSNPCVTPRVIQVLSECYPSVIQVLCEFIFWITPGVTPGVISRVIQVLHHIAVCQLQNNTTGPLSISFHTI